MFTPHQMMYKTEGAWQKLLNTDDLQNIVNNYVKTSDTANWQKQKIFADNNWKLTSCPKGTDLGKFLQSSSVPVGFSIVRDDNKAYNFMTIKEGSDWIYAIAMVGSADYSQLCTYRILHGDDQGYQYYKDMNGVADAGFLYNADGSLKWSLFASDGKDFSQEVWNHIAANKSATAFYVQGGTTGLPVTDSARGLILPSHDGVGVAIMIGDNGDFYVGQADGNDPKKTTNWWKVPSTDELEQHSLEKLDYRHRLYVPSGGDTLKAIAAEVNKGQGSFTFFASPGATNLPFNDPDAKNTGWRGLVLHDNDSSEAHILWTSSTGQMGTSMIIYANTTTPSWKSVNLFTQRSSLVSTDDLNSVMTSGDYTFGSTKPQNAPDGVGAWSYMHVISSTDLEDHDTTMVLQMVFIDSHVVGNDTKETGYLGYTRTWSGNPASWSPWVPFGQTDSGWVDIASVDPSKWIGYSNWDTNPSNVVAKARKNNYVVAIDTWFTNKVNMVLNVMDEVTIARLPSGFEPTRNQRQVMQGSSNDTWLLTVTSSGEVQMARYSQDGTVDAGCWFSGTMTYMAD